MPTVVEFETLNELFEILTKKYKNSSKTAFAYKTSDDAGYKTINWDQAEEEVRAMAAEVPVRGGETSFLYPVINRTSTDR